jgi:hypothetical protein
MSVSNSIPYCPRGSATRYQPVESTAADALTVNASSSLSRKMIVVATG